MRMRMWAVAGLAAVPLLIAGCGSSSPGSSSTPGKAPGKAASKAASPAKPGTSAQAAVVKTRKTSAGTVLTNAAGLTLYWYAKDTAAKSNCTGACATTWPALLGKPQAAAGTALTGFGTIHGTGGAVQATYKGHPLYTFKGDTAPGETKGTSVSGWHVATTSTPMLG